MNIYFGTSPRSQAFKHAKTMDEIVTNTCARLEDGQRNHPELGVKTEI